MTFGGIYRIIDFTLSNCANSIYRRALRFKMTYRHQAFAQLKAALAELYEDMELARGVAQPCGGEDGRFVHVWRAGQVGDRSRDAQQPVHVPRRERTGLRQLRQPRPRPWLRFGRGQRRGPAQVGVQPTAVACPRALAGQREQLFLLVRVSRAVPRGDGALAGKPPLQTPPAPGPTALARGRRVG